jgi:anti-sigma factor RsiW
MSVAVPTALSCKQLVELVTEFLEGTMAPSERTRFEMHIAACSGCAAYLRQMRDVLRLTGHLSEDALPERAQEELLRAFRSWKKP